MTTHFCLIFPPFAHIFGLLFSLNLHFFFLEWQYNLVVKNMSLKFRLFKILASKYLTALTLNFLTYEIGIIIKKTIIIGMLERLNEIIFVNDL